MVDVLLHERLAAVAVLARFAAEDRVAAEAAVLARARLRSAAIAAVGAGMAKRRVAEMAGVSPAAVRWWLEQSS